MPTLSLLMPAYNEQYYLEDIVHKVLSVRFQDGVDIELIIVDDASKDRTPEILERLAQTDARIHVIRHEHNRGKGAAIRTAIQAATGEFCAIQDADLEYDPADLPRLLQPVLDGRADVVYGSRFLVSGTKRVLFFWHSLGNRFLTCLSNMLTDLDLTDMETCYKVCRLSLLRSIPLRSNRFGIEPELTAKFAKRGARICEAPISYYGRTYREGKKIAWWDGVGAICTAIKYWLIDDLYEERYGHDILCCLSRAHHFNAWMVDMIQPYVGSHVLEIGSGLGNLTTQLLPRESYCASDIDPLHLEYLQGRCARSSRVQVKHIDVSRPEDFAGIEGRFDTVICMNVLEHIEDHRRALRNMFGALRGGGRLCLLVPQGKWLYGSLDKALGHYRRYTEQELRELLVAAGFEVQKLFSFNRISVPGWLLNGRILNRKTFGRFQLKVLDSLTWLWRWIDPILPWKGVSLIAIAQRPETPAG